MSVFISVSTSAFGAGAEGLSQRQDARHVRRPTRGIQIKQDTYATIRVVSASGEDLYMVNSGGDPWFAETGVGTANRYSNFILQQVAEQRVEKQQIIETFGEDYVFFFGERPRLVQFSGLLVNTKDFNWKYEWWENYDKLFRGTRLVEENARLYIYYDDVVMSGYLMQSQTQDSADNPYIVQFGFQLFVTDSVNIGSVGSVYFQEYAAADAQGDRSRALPSGAAAPDSKAQALAAAKEAKAAGTGGLTAFLRASAKYVNNADFAVQSQLENVRNTLYGRQLVWPADLSAAVRLPPIDAQASLPPAPVNRPIREMIDEYVVHEPLPPSFDKTELSRVQKELSLRTADELEKRARADLAKLGIDTSKRSTAELLLGRSVLAAGQAFASFGIRQADPSVGEGVFGDLTGLG